MWSKSVYTDILSFLSFNFFHLFIINVSFTYLFKYKYKCENKNELNII